MFASANRGVAPGVGWAGLMLFNRYLLSIAGCTIYKVKYVAALLYCARSPLPPYETGRTPTARLTSLQSVSVTNTTVPRGCFAQSMTQMDVL